MNKSKAILFPQTNIRTGSRFIRIIASVDIFFSVRLRAVLTARGYRLRNALIFALFNLLLFGITLVNIYCIYTEKKSVLILFSTTLGKNCVHLLQGLLVMLLSMNRYKFLPRSL